MSRLKIGLILPGSIWYAPYVRIYTRIFDGQKIDYSIISWNREGDDESEGFQYNVPCAKGHSSAGWKAYKGYVRFIKKTIKEQQFDRIIVFGPQMTCLLSTFLLIHYRRRYMIDYRDLSIEQKAGFKQLFALMLYYSNANVISSPGFKRCLPKREYLISHNFDVNTVKTAISKDSQEIAYNTKNGIDVLTIGAIRDLSSNMEVVKALANKEGVKLRFVGKGGASETISEYCRREGIKNVSFTGFYQKQEEADYVEDATFMNIFYPRVITHDTAMSNRFYHSLIFKRPMIVTKDTTQGDYVEEERLGIAVENCEHLYEELRCFLESESFGDYAERCNALLRLFLKDQDTFEGAVRLFVTQL